MCRILYVRSETRFAVSDHLRPFARLSRDSREFQGHGWGCAVLREGAWSLYRNLSPIWDDDVTRFGETTALVAHARSAFENRGIELANNMPFVDDRYAFSFNGELRGVRLDVPGRIGAEKVFNFIKRFDRGDMLAAMRRAVPIIARRTRHLRAMNFVIADTERGWVSTTFTQEPEYFTLHRKRAGNLVAVCSEPYPGEAGWEPIAEGTIEEIQ